MPFVSVTRLRLRSWRFFPAFMAYTLASAWQVRRASGFLDGYLAGDPDRGSWTVTVWQDATVPTPEIAFQGMRRQGRLSKVHHPSPKHATGQLVGPAAPRVALALRRSENPR